MALHLITVCALPDTLELEESMVSSTYTRALCLTHKPVPDSHCSVFHNYTHLQATVFSIKD